MRTTWICYWCEKEQDTDGFPAPMQKCEECIKPLEEVRATCCETCKGLKTPGLLGNACLICSCHTEKAIRAIPEWAAMYALTDIYEREGLVGIQRLLLEAYKQGQMNPQVGFLRQYLNERPVMSDGSLWTDEDILRFLRIPFTTNPKEDV